MLLHPGDTIAIVAPAGRIEKNVLVPALQVLKDWGLKVITGDFVYEQAGYFAGTDANRLQDFQGALDNSAVKAILCARGGYGTSRIMDKLDFSLFQKSPKWIIGFSDITALHQKVNQLGIPSVHGPMAVHVGREDYLNPVEKLKELLFKGKISYEIPSHPLNIPGRVSGLLTGGNLTMIIQSLGTPDEINTSGKVLLIEDIGEDIYKIDRMLLHLRHAGKLNKIKGLLAGHFTDVKDTNPSFGMNVHEVIRSHIQDKAIPVVFDFPAGHESENYPVMLGNDCLVEVTNERVSFYQDRVM